MTLTTDNGLNSDDVFNGIRTSGEIAAVVAALAPKPVNVLASTAPSLSLADFAALGVRRVSVGASLARAAWAGFVQAAERIAHDGQFDRFGEPSVHRNLDQLFG